LTLRAAVALQAFFVAAGSGQRLCLLHSPATAPRGLVVYLHPWAEEMNKARRMASLQARALAEAGFAVLQIDLRGCGDSSDSWADTRWSDWVDDAVLAVATLRQHWPQASLPLWLWGLRSGCLLACQAAHRLAEPCHLLFWQPAPSGKPVLQQFLRLKAAAHLQGDAKAVLERVRQGLAAGHAQEIAGYALSPGLAQGLEHSSLKPAAANPGRLLWLEVSTRNDATLLPGSAAPLQAFRDAGHGVQAQVCQGPAFWQTQEIEDAPALIQATTQALLEAMAAERAEAASAA